MRTEVIQLVQLGPLPSEEGASVELVQKFESALHSITKPVSNEEARALVRLFGNDSCFGLAWTMLHLIETAPDWPLLDCLSNLNNEWVASLRNRAIRGGKL